MEIAFILVLVSLVAYVMLALYDGVFLHLIKYKLYQHKESQLEHLTHTIRSILFVGILYCLFISLESNKLFYFGLLLVFLDLVTMIIDAYTEKESRVFMGGLPRGEYILHLLVNGFHFATIALFFVIKIDLSGNNVVLVTDFQEHGIFKVFKMVTVNLLPGAILIGLLHVLVYFERFHIIFRKLRIKCF